MVQRGCDLTVRFVGSCRRGPKAAYSDLDGPTKASKRVWWYKGVEGGEMLPCTGSGRERIWEEESRSRRSRRHCRRRHCKHQRRAGPDALFGARPRAVRELERDLRARAVHVRLVERDEAPARAHAAVWGEVL